MIIASIQTDRTWKSFHLNNIVEASLEEGVQMVEESVRLYSLMIEPRLN